MRIGIYALAKNEAKHAAAWAAATADADVRVVTDTGSTDGTVELLEAAGFGEDWDYWQRASRLTGIMRVEEPLAWYTVGNPKEYTL